MYRYTVDNAITYTSEDFVLFRESPFACWMERLALENPDHGIPPDNGSIPPGNSMERQDDIADTLRAEGRNVVLVDWEMEESRRRSATLDAMRRGADFVVNGQLALGPLSGSANLLMRTSGYSELGGYLYVPCDTQDKTCLHSAFRLCFLADLLHSLQGQLPPQMLIIRGGTDILPLGTEDHIYHYRAVKQRFMNAMREFRKHRMPDPAESSHFGRWSDCAHEVLKQRALTSVGEDCEKPQERPEEQALPLMASADGTVVAAVELAAFAVSETDDSLPTFANTSGESRQATDAQVCSGVGNTLAEQANMLDVNAYQRVGAEAVPGHTPNLALAMAAPRDPSGRRLGDRVAERDAMPSEDSLSHVALENLAFIGSDLRLPLIDEPAALLVDEDEAVLEPAAGDDIPGEELAPTSVLAQTPTAFSFPEQGESLDTLRPIAVTPLENVPRPDAEAPVSGESVDFPVARPDKAHPLDSAGFNAVGGAGAASVIDLDASPLSLAGETIPPPATRRFGWDALDDADDEPAQSTPAREIPPAKANDHSSEAFSNSLITNDQHSD